MSGGLQGQGLHFNNGAFGKINPYANQATLGLNNFAANQQNPALMALIQQQMLNLQQNSHSFLKGERDLCIVMHGGFQNAQQANLVSNNLAQALALCQQNATPANLRTAATLASESQFHFS